MSTFKEMFTKLSKIESGIILIIKNKYNQSSIK